MLPFVRALLTAARVFFRSRTEIALEVLALRQQLSLLKRKRARPRLNAPDRLFWTVFATNLVSLERRACDREAGNGRRLASRRLPPLLALAILASRWPTEGSARRSES